MPFEMLVHLEVRRIGGVGEKGWPEVPTKDRKGFGQGMKYPCSKGTRPSLCKG